MLIMLLLVNAAGVSARPPAATQLNERQIHAFVANKGQVRDQFGHERKDIHFRFTAAPGLNIFLAGAALHYQFVAPLGDAPAATAPPQAKVITDAADSLRTYRMDVTLVGGNPGAVAIAGRSLSAYERYYTEWSGEAGVIAHSFETVTYKNVYPGIDWVLSARNGQLKHEFFVHPGGKVSDIQVRYDGATALRLESDGSLTAVTPLGNITEQAPQCFSQDGSPVASAFRLEGNVLRYEVAPYKGVLLIDPTLDWATYFGDLGADGGSAVATDAAQNVYMAGSTESSVNIATSGAFQTVYGRFTDVFLAKFSTSGSLLWATYVGGSGRDNQALLHVSSSGRIFLAGATASNLGMASAGVHQTACGGNDDAFLACFDSSGKRYWSTYFGGAGYELPGGAWADAAGNVYLGGCTYSSSGIASATAFKTTLSGTVDNFLVKFDTSGKRIWGTYFGGADIEWYGAVCGDRSGNVYLAGRSGSDTGISTPRAFQTAKGFYFEDGFLAKFDSSGRRIWGTYYGGGRSDYFSKVTVDRSDNLYLLGYGVGNELITAGSFNPLATYGPLLVKMDSSGRRIWAAYYNDKDYYVSGLYNYSVYDLALDVHANIYLTGFADTGKAMATAGAYQPRSGGRYDAFLTQFDSSGSRLYCTYWGAAGTDGAYGVAADGMGNVYVTGNTVSDTGIATTGAFKTKWSTTYYDAMLGKFCFTPVADTLEGPDTLCAKSTIMLSTATGGGTWYSKTGRSSVSGGKVTGILSGADTIMYVLANHCAADTVYKPLYIKPAPDAGSITAADTVCLGDSVLLGSSMPGGTWYSGGLRAVVSGSYLKGAAAGTDTVYYIVTNSCGSDTARKAVLVYECTLSLAQQKGNPMLLLVPNPVRNTLTLTAPAVIKQVVVLDLSGRVVHQAQPHSRQVQLDLSNLAKGVYTLRADDYPVQRVVKQ